MNALAQNYDDEIDMILAYHNGDVRAAIETLLRERDFLCHEIKIASMAMSAGFTRGWRPSVFSK